MRHRETICRASCVTHSVRILEALCVENFKFDLWPQVGNGNTVHMQTAVEEVPPY